jgi:hypothetical protein
MHNLASTPPGQDLDYNQNSKKINYIKREENRTTLSNYETVPVEKYLADQKKIQFYKY